MESLGEYLRKERERRQRSLRDLSEETRIPLRFLQALEEDRPEELPGAAFARGFLILYARALGLDEEAVQRRFQGQFKKTRLFESSGLPPEILKPTFPLEPPRRSWGVRWYVLGAAVLAGAVFLAFFFSRSQELPEPPRVSRSVPEPAAPSATRVPDREPRGPAVLRLEAIEATWLEVRLDGHPPREAYLKPGETVSWKVQERIRLTLGNAGGVRITWDGKDLGTPGRRGEVLRDLLFQRGEERPRRLESKQPLGRVPREERGEGETGAGR